MAQTAATTTRLLSFLGKGDYQLTAYRWPAVGGASVSSRYVAAAVAGLAGVDEVSILATTAAEATHGEALRQTFREQRLPAPCFVRLADGKDPQELWTNFRVVGEEVVRGGAQRVIVDITHGFRSQPFFAGAVLGFVRAIAESSAEVQVVYGAFEAPASDGATPIWDLTPFAELSDWAQALGHFLRTGDARAAASAAERVGRSLRRDWAQAGRPGAEPSVSAFARALREFSDALVTVRVGELLLERGKGDRPAEGPARVRALAEALERSRTELERHIPPLAEVLDRVGDMLRPLMVPGADLSGAPAGERDLERCGPERRRAGLGQAIQERPASHRRCPQQHRARGIPGRSVSGKDAHRAAGPTDRRAGADARAGRRSGERA
jgi:CRISPR-associated protein Csx16